MLEKIKEVIACIDKNIDYENEELSTGKDGNASLPITKANFHELAAGQNDRKIAFIDGGNSEIISSPNLSMQFIRLFACVFFKNKMVYSAKEEFFILAKACQNKNSIDYDVQFFNKDNSKISFDSFDSTIREGLKAASISRTGDIARRFSEIDFAKKIIGRLNANDIIVLDGTLEGTFTGEGKRLLMLIEEAKANGIGVTSVAKTCSLLTKKGNTLTTVLHTISPYSSWYYHPVVSFAGTEHPAELFFAKLHKNSSRVFRIECAKSSADIISIGELASILGENSSDVSFPGYPYGLVCADKFARIPNSEREYIQNIVHAKSSGKRKYIESSLFANDAHSVLDKMCK